MPLWWRRYELAGADESWDLALAGKPERTSIYDRQLLALALSLMSVGLVIVASASITEGVSLQNDAFFFVKRHLIFLMFCLLCSIGTLCAGTLLATVGGSC